jgi:hypothetical protein
VDVFGDHLRARRPCVFNHHITLLTTSEVIPKLSTQVTGEVVGYPQFGILLGYVIVFHFLPVPLQMAGLCTNCCSTATHTNTGRRLLTRRCAYVVSRTNELVDLHL